MGAGLYGSPLSQSGGVVVINMGDSCDDVDALDRLGDMWRGVCTDRAERTERSEEAGEFEFAARVCKTAEPVGSCPHPHCGDGCKTGAGGMAETYAAAGATSANDGFNSAGCESADAREDCYRIALNTGKIDAFAGRIRTHLGIKGLHRWYGRVEGNRTIWRCNQRRDSDERNRSGRDIGHRGCRGGRGRVTHSAGGEGSIHALDGRGRVT